jgi:flagellar L-ring protein precursor FlgH
MIKRGLLLICVLALLVGCEALSPPSPGKDPDYAPTYPATPNPNQSRYVHGAIYNPETTIPLFETPRARHVGDILTIRLVEKTQGQKRATSRQRKNDDIQITNNTVFGRPINLGHNYNFDFDIETQRQFNGDAQSIQNNELSGSISVTVAQVLSNGNMVIQGEKWVGINQGKEYIRLAGIVRPVDITPDNSISSDRVANAKITYGGVGQVNNTNAQGWFSRFLWGPLFPV